MRSWIWAVLATAAVGLSGCGGEPEQPAARTGPLRIVTSIFPLQSLVTQMTGAAAEVEVLMPPGANPHNFAPTPADLAKLADADVLVVVGLALDPWAERAAAAVGGAGRLKVLRFADLVAITPQVETEHADGHHHEHGHAHAPGSPAHGEPGHVHGPECVHAANAHPWLEPALTAQFVTELSIQLAALRPELGPTLKPAATVLAEDITQLDAQFREKLRGVPVKKLVTFHNAFDQMAARYGLEVVDHLVDIELAPGGEVTSGDLVQAIEAIREHGLKVIYAEPQFPAKVIDRLRDETGVTVLTLDPEGSPQRPGYETWQAMMKSNVKTLAEGQALQ